ncbi:hypothetical protein E2320_002203 [Naja naja]|nr:hypothetical protein E2320_002203 [Naja naja]
MADPNEMAEWQYEMAMCSQTFEDLPDQLEQLIIGCEVREEGNLLLLEIYRHCTICPQEWNRERSKKKGESLIRSLQDGHFIWAEDRFETKLKGYQPKLQPILHHRSQLCTQTHLLNHALNLGMLSTSPSITSESTHSPKGKKALRKPVKKANLCAKPSRSLTPNNPEGRELWQQDCPSFRMQTVKKLTRCISRDVVLSRETGER